MGFELHPSKDGQWYYIFVDTNGRTLVTSEMYPTQANAARGVEDFKDSDLTESEIKVVEDEDSG